MLTLNTKVAPPPPPPPPLILLNEFNFPIGSLIGRGFEGPSVMLLKLSRGWTETGLASRSFFLNLEIKAKAENLSVVLRHT